jgi:hypothetical protein
MILSKQIKTSPISLSSVWRKAFILITLLIGVWVKVAAQSTLITVYPLQDNSMYSENGTRSNGAGTNIFAGHTFGAMGSEIRRGLVKFDVSSIPANAILDSVVLRVSVVRSANNTTTPHTFAIHRLTQSWGEGTSNGLGTGAQASNNDATWTRRFYSPAQNWTTAGGTFVATASASSAMFYQSFPLNYGFWRNGGMIADVNAWRSSPSSNHGWIILGDETVQGSAKGFASREEGVFPKPELRIYYSLPGVSNVYINELNPNKQWIELFNPSGTTIDLSNYYLANGATVVQIGNSLLLSGSLMLEANKYTVLSWASVGAASGEFALYDGNPTNGSTQMKDYIQYGAANQQRAASAVSQSVWSSASTFLASISSTTDELSYALNPSLSYASGTATNPANYLTQRQTPSLSNVLCPSSSMLTGSIVDAQYKSTGLITLTSSLSATAWVKLLSEQAIQLNANTLLPNGSFVEAKIEPCN